jgi:diadenylate cyclase
MVSLFPLRLTGIPKPTAMDVIDVLIVAVLIYQFLLMIRGRRAAHVLVGLCMLGAIYGVALWAKLEVLRTILTTLAPYTGIALIVMFQTELRRMLARLGRRPFLGVSQLERREVTQEILLALAHLSQRKIGALIVVERKIGLRTFVESGVTLDAMVSRDLLCAIFHPGGALHDGAVIIQGDRVGAAACFLPLSTNPLLITELGTRHRAALGITEESDCFSVVVSEETGKMSIAAFGLYQAIFMANAGAAYDNSKKIVEVELKQKGTDLHAATVICDTVGDPFKDTSSVALNPIIKFTTLFGLLAVELAVRLTATSGATLGHLLAAGFFAVSIVFVHRSFYKMRIRGGGAASVEEPVPATEKNPVRAH